MKNKDFILEAICCLLIMLFAYTGVSKLLDWEAFKFDLINNMDFLDRIGGTRALGIIIPVIEILTAMMLLIPKFRVVGLSNSVVLMFVFTLYVGGILIFMREKPCTCGGVLREMSWVQHFWFNIAFLILSLIGLVLHRRMKRSRLQAVLLS